MELPARRELSDWGELLYEPSERDDTWSVALEASGRGLAHEAARALRRVREASRQTGSTVADLRVAVVRISRWHTPVESVVFEIKSQIEGSSNPYEGLDGLVLLNHHRLDGPPSFHVALLPFSRSQYPTWREMNWVRGLVSWSEIG